MYSLIWFFLGLFMDVHVSLQVDSIDKLLGTQVTCNHRLPGMQQSVCLQVISTCEGWTTIITNELLLISVPCHVPFEVCTFDKRSVALCTLVSFVSWWKETTQYIKFNEMVVGNLERLMLTTVHALMKPLKTTMKGMEYIKHERPCLTTFPNTKKRVDNTTRSGVFLMNFEVFGNVVENCFECLINILNQN